MTPHRTPSLSRRVPFLLATVASALVLACGQGDAYEPSTVTELRLKELADSAAGDRAALMTLPPALQGVLRLEPYLDDSFIAASEDAECRIMDADLPERLRAERRRVRLRLPDSSAVVVYVRAAAGSAALERVEIVRRPLEGDQLGFIWDAADDGTLEVRWPPELRGGTEASTQPRGGPIPRAVRALGRRVLALDCAPAATIDAQFEAGLERGAGDSSASARPPRPLTAQP